MDDLIQLLDFNLIPELEGLKQSTSSATIDEAAMHRLFITDVFLWMHLGVEIEVFPMKAAEECFDEYLRSFFQSINSSEAGARTGSPTSYANHSNESWTLILAFPHFAGILIEKAMRGESNLFSSEQSLFSRPDTLVPMFRSLLLVRDHLQHNAVRSFIRAVNFFSAAQWDSLWRENCSPEDVERAEAPEFSGLNKASVFAGYLILYRYGLQMKELLETFAKDPHVEPADAIKVGVRVREMQKWIVNLYNRFSSDRLALIQTELTEALEEQARRDENVSFTFVAAIQKSMEESLNFIGIPMFIFAK
jgi:hypothetical protein